MDKGMTALEVVRELNGELCEKYNETELYFSYSTEGSSEIIEFDNHILWCSEDDNREYLDNTNDYEDLLVFVKREFNNYADRLKSFVLSGPKKCKK